MKHIFFIAILACGVAFMSCSPAGGERRGHEFMPDMVHTTGYEANLYNYYYYNRWGTEEEYKKYVMPRHSVPGTVPRGEIALANAADEASRLHAMEGFTGMDDNGLAFAPNGSVPYEYGNTDADRSRASREITRNPFPITTSGLETGRELYNIYCAICHGTNGDGQGYLVREADPAKGIVAGVYPAAPANLLQDTFIHASTGRIYHAIMHGKNVMESYADKLSYRERWEVIHYIRSLQANAQKLVYSDSLNTFNNESLPFHAIDMSSYRNPSSPRESGTKKEGLSENMNKH